MPDRTIIKIPGKNTRDQSKVAKAARQALNRSRGRPLKLTRKETNSLIPALIVKPPKKRSLKNIKSKKKMSQLERLPTELLEKVFLYCLNVDLPRASPIIGAKLSSEAVYMRTILFSFGPQWNAYYSERSSQSPEEHLLTDYVGDEAELQSSILRCRWATLAVLLRGTDFWDQRTAATRPNKPAYWSFSRYARDAEPRDLDNTGLENSPIDSILPKISIPFARESAAPSFDDAFSRFSSIVTDRNFTLDEFPAHQEQYCCLAKGVELPHSILRGPWGEEEIRYLFWVMDAGGELNWTTSTTGEIALRGFRDAIIAGDLRVVWLLQQLGVWEKYDTDMLIWILQNVGGDRYSKFTMLYQALDRMHTFGSFNESGRYRFMQALAQERDKAERIPDQETLHFFDRIEESGLIL